MKMASVLAGLATSAFMVELAVHFDADTGSDLWAKMPHFDARVISMPSEMEAANMLLWRNLDATKNAISMAASHYYSHRELHGKSGAEKQEMLFEKNINFNDYPSFFKRGTWVKRFVEERILTVEEWIKIPEKHRPEPDEPLVRSNVSSFDLPPLNKISNRVEILFHNADPIANT
jgi:tRNA(His) 5'-end guanylyltransferase